MALVVQKYGGTSVGSLDRMKVVAERALRCQRAGNDVVLIVSAMSGETNRLLGMAHQISATPEMREMDVLAATGEQVSAALVAMTVQALATAVKVPLAVVKALLIIRTIARELSQDRGR